MKRIIFTREHPLALDWQYRLQQVGYTVEHVPLITCQTNRIPEAFYRTLNQQAWLFFTSQVAVKCFFQEANGAFDHLSLQIATIGPRTSETVRAWGFEATFESPRFYAKDLVADWCAIYTKPQNVYLPQSHLAAKTLADGLSHYGHQVNAWVMYETIFNQVGQQQIPSLLDDSPTIWTFASGSAWQSFRQYADDLPTHHQIAVIGETTKQMIEADGFVVSYVPDKPQIEQMIEIILKQDNV